MRPEQAFLLGVIVPLAILFGVWLGWDRRRRFDEKLERHGVRVAAWQADQPDERLTGTLETSEEGA